MMKVTNQRCRLTTIAYNNQTAINTEKKERRELSWYKFPKVYKGSDEWIISSDNAR